MSPSQSTTGEARPLPPAAIDAETQEREQRRWTPKKIIGWGLVALLGAVAWTMIALVRGETINAIWFVFAAVCTYLIAYRFYTKVIERHVTRPDDTRATPAEYNENGQDFMPTDRRVLFGHHFAAIAGAGPLVGPVLAAQMGYLPGTIWIIVGVVLAGAVQDYLVLFFSMRRKGRSLGQMARDELGRVGGTAAILATLLIMLIIVAILALVVVNALGESPWGVFSVGMTLPIALFMGVYLRFLRPGRVTEISVIGFVLLMAAIIAGSWVSEHPVLSEVFTLERTTIALLIIVYGFVAAVLPVWLLLAPRDYLSTFMKIGTIVMLALAIVIVRPVLNAPALSEFAGGDTGPVWSGSLFPFLFVTIACGALSGFHALIASGTTPKLIEKERQTRLIGYGGMLMESFVAIMALVAALSIDRGIYFAMNASAAATLGTPEGAAAFVNGLGLTGVNLTPEVLTQTAESVGEESIISRTGGAPTLALGLAMIMQQLTSSGLTAFWYHFAIMFEALFILTAVDAGTRVARFQLQESLGNVVPRFKDTSWRLGSWVCTAAMVAGWGAILFLGVTDPLGGINTFFPLFGISNQLLAAIALAICMAIAAKGGVRRWLWVPALPLAFAAVVTITGSLYKIFSPNPAVGYWAQNSLFRDALAAGRTSQGTATSVEAMQAVVRNTTVQGTLSVVFLVLAVIVIAASVLSVVRTVRGTGLPSSEEPPTPSQMFAPAGFVPTPAEKELQARWDEVPERPGTLTRSH
ncbi:carbon starvation protein [Auraticoccus monumenti]|uniref:Carbon starvation protein n=2 Tax=Auraticoccus monumenti TaxID=675864 RepID=A0A1G6VRI6_9ACTN|nr:carbon starvation protein [Auraticoccus monumenti]